MANVNWIDGGITPPEEKEYYIIIEAQHDIIHPETGETLVREGDIEITADEYGKGMGFLTIGKENPFWKVLAWADILYPSIPEDIRGRVTTYFGVKIGKEKM